MKYWHWLAVAGLAALSTAAMAQSSVTLYGVVDMFYNSAKSGSTSYNRMMDGGHSASRPGFRGSEDLGGGLRLNLVMEGGVDGPTGAGTIPGPGFNFARQADMALASPWGTLEIGRMYTPVFNALFLADPLGMNALFSPVNLVYAADAQPGLRAFAPRASGMLRYRTPASLPLLFDAGYAFGDTASPNRNNGEIYSATLAWNQEPLYLTHSFQSAVTDSATAPVKTPYRSRPA